MVTRTTRGDLERAGGEALGRVLSDLGGTNRPATSLRGDLLLRTPDGREVLLDVYSATVVNPELAQELVARVAGTGGKEDVVPVVVGDLVGEAAREILRTAGWGWLDRRGHLRIVTEGLWLDVGVDPLPRAPRDQGGQPVRGASGIAVAAAHLLWREGPPGVRALARRVGLSAGAISVARRRLVDAGLLGSDGVAEIPELFWALAAAWPPGWTPIGVPPERVFGEGVVITGTHAGAQQGASVVVTRDYPLELLAPDEASFQRVRALSGRAGEGQPGARLALAPTPLAVDAELVRSPGEEGRPTAHPLFVALELAADPGRGVEALERWAPVGWSRVW